MGAISRPNAMFNLIKRIIEKRRRHPFFIICFRVFAANIIAFLFILISFQPVILNAFDKRDVLYLDMIKNYEDNISLQFPVDVYTTENGDIYIIDSGPNRIWIFNRKLLPISMIDKKNGLNYPISIAVDKKGMIFVSEATPEEKHKGCITIFDPIGRKKGTIQFEGFAGNETFVARDMAVDEDGNLYLAGGSSGPLVIISPMGASLKPFSQ